jgi:hypothetical protein
VKLRILSVLLVLVFVLAGCVPLPQAPSAVPTDASASRAPVGVTVVQGLRVTKPAIFNDAVSVLGNTTVGGTLGVTGNITGKVLQYGASGQKVVCSSQTITGTGTLATGLATPSVVTLGMGADANYDHNLLSYTNASATVVAKVWNGAATPAAAATGVPVSWCVVGTP